MCGRGPPSLAKNVTDYLRPRLPVFLLVLHCRVDRHASQNDSNSLTQMRRIYLGRHLYGFAAIAFAVISFVWHDFAAPWQQIHALGNVPHREILVYIVAAGELFGGIAIQWRRTAHAGAVALGCIFLMWALLWVPHIIAEPKVYDRYGNFFEQFSIVSGALIVLATGFEGDRLQAVHKSPENARALAYEGLTHRWLARLGYMFFGICVVSFTLEQFFYLRGTASFVPNWIPPGQMFWAIDLLCARSDRAAFRTLRRSCLSPTHPYDHRLPISGMAAEALC